MCYAIYSNQHCTNHIKNLFLTFFKSSKVFSECGAELKLQEI